MDLPTFLVQCLNAIQYGLLLFLVASGLTLIFGIMGVINLAHGSFYMIGAYMAYALAPGVQQVHGGSQCTESNTTTNNDSSSSSRNVRHAGL